MTLQDYGEKSPPKVGLIPIHNSATPQMTQNSSAVIFFTQ